MVPPSMPSSSRGRLYRDSLLGFRGTRAPGTAQLSRVGRRPVVYWFNSGYAPGLGRQADLPTALSAFRRTALVHREERQRWWGRPVVSRREADGMVLVQERFPRRFASLERRAPRFAMLLERALVEPVLWRRGFGGAILIAPTGVAEFFAAQRRRPRIFDLLDPDLNGDTEKFYAWMPLVIARVEGVIATATALAEDAARFGARPFLLSNGCSTPTSTASTTTRSRDIVFVGTIDQRVDLSVVTDIARALPDEHIVLAGRVLDFLRPRLETLLHDHPNVDYLGPIDVDARSALLEQASIGIIPFHCNWVGDRINAVKMYEYCAAGLSVVATPIAECVSAPFVEVAATADEFAAIVRSILDADRDVASALATASANTWKARAEALDAHLVAYDSADTRRRPPGERPPSALGLRRARPWRFFRSRYWGQESID